MRRITASLAFACVVAGCGNHHVKPEDIAAYCRAYLHDQATARTPGRYMSKIESCGLILQDAREERLIRALETR